MFSIFKSKDPTRIRDFEQFCFNNGFNFSEKDDLGLKTMLQLFNIFKQSRSGKINHIAHSKTHDLTEQEYLFDYHYTVSTGKSSVTYKQTIYFLNSKLLALPDFRLKPEHFGHKIAAFLGIDDIDFEQYPVFSDKYLLKGDDEHFIRATFDDNILKFFSKHHGWTCEAVNYYLIIYKFNSIPLGIEIEKFYEVVKGLADLFRQVSQDHLYTGLE